MAYIHQMALAKAKKKLYMLGSSNARRDKTSFDEDSQAIFGGIANMVKSGQPRAKASDKPMSLAEAAKRQAGFRAGTGYDAGLSLEGTGGGVSGPEGMGYLPHPDLAVATGAEQGMRQMAVTDPSMPGPAINEGVGVWSAKRAQEQLKTNADADKTRMGGTYSYNGLQQADKDAQGNAQDRLRNKALLGQNLGLGGSVY